jgi:hypothetical protein
MNTLIKNALKNLSPVQPAVTKAQVQRTLGAFCEGRKECRPLSSRARRMSKIVFLYIVAELLAQRVQLHVTSQ